MKLVVALLMLAIAFPVFATNPDALQTRANQLVASQNEVSTQLDDLHLQNRFTESEWTDLWHQNNMVVMKLYAGNEAWQLCQLKGSSQYCDMAEKELDDVQAELILIKEAIKKAQEITL